MTNEFLKKAGNFFDDLKALRPDSIQRVNARKRGADFIDTLRINREKEYQEQKSALLNLMKEYHSIGKDFTEKFACKKLNISQLRLTRILNDLIADPNLDLND